MSFGNPTPGEGETYVDLGYQITLANRTFYFAFFEDITKALIEEIRAFYQSNPRVSAEYRWSGIAVPNGDFETDADSKIHIAKEDADKPEMQVSVLIGKISANPNDLWLGQKMGDLVIKNPAFDSSVQIDEEIVGDQDFIPEFLEVGERRGGKVDFTINLKVRGYAKLQVDRVSDLLIHGFVGPIRRGLYKRAMNWQPNSWSIGEDEEVITNLQKRYVRPMSMKLQAEWYDDFFYETVTVQDVVDKHVYLLKANIT